MLRSGWPAQNKLHVYVYMCVCFLFPFIYFFLFISFFFSLLELSEKWDGDDLREIGRGEGKEYGQNI